MNGSAAVAARQCRAVPAFSVALVLPSLYYIEAEVESGCYCNEDTMCSIQPLLGACKKFCSHTTTTTSSLSLLQLYFSLSLLIWYNICTYLPIYIYYGPWSCVLKYYYYILSIILLLLTKGCLQWILNSIVLWADPPSKSQTFKVRNIWFLSPLENWKINTLSPKSILTEQS